MKKTTNDGSPQGVNREFSEHSLVSPDPMRSIRNLHIQQRQNCLQSEVPKVNETHSESPRLSQPQEANLISFTLPHGQQSTNKRNNDEPKRQRSPRKIKQRDEWQINQGQVKQNREISHISPGGQGKVFNTEEPSVSYLQIPKRTAQENNKVCMKCGENGHGNVIVELQHGANSVCPKHMQHKPAGGMQISLGITQLHPLEGQLQYRTRKKLKQLGQVHRQDTNRRQTKDSCSPPTNSMFPSPRNTAYGNWAKEVKAAKMLEETPISDNLHQHTHRYNSIGNDK